MKHILTIVLSMLLASAAYGQYGDTGKMQGKMPSGGAMMMSSGGKVDFMSLDDARMIAVKGPTVLYFHADWCPVCRADMRQIDSRLSELGDITVVVVDYDRAAELKRRYGVTYQHTYVQIDGDGKKIALWNGGGMDGILKNVVRAGM